MQIAKAWLGDASWDAVIAVNFSLCQAQGVTHQLNQRHQTAQHIWEKNYGKRLTLVEALDLCRRCNDLRPFLFHCSNTFTTLGKNLVEDWAQQLSSVEAQILRTTVTHFVDGQVGGKELKAVLDYLESKARLTQPHNQSATPVITPVQRRQPA